MSFPFAEVEKKIGYVFRNKNFLKTAFVHSTYSNAKGLEENNERMEFLGDAVLQLIVSERLYFQGDNGRKLSEGEMTEFRQRAVCKEALLEAAEELELKSYLLMEGGEANVGEKTVSSLFETVTAAVFLDGGYKEAENFVLQNLKICRAENYKGALQELLQSRKKDPPRYEITREGADNAPVFTCRVSADGQTGEGKGKTKIASQQQAAKTLLKLLSNGEI